MADQLQEMLQKIYTEGIDKAKAEAERILQDAREQADRVKIEAGIEAERIIKDAKHEADKLGQNINTDLKMAAQQTMNTVKQKLTSTLLNKTLNDNTAKSLDDNEFLQKLILEIVAKWSPDSSAVITIPESKRKELEAYFKESVLRLFKGELNVEFSPLMKNGITIAPQNGSFKLSFTDEDFTNFFKSFLRPRAIQILFGE